MLAPTLVARSFADLRPDAFAMVGSKPASAHMAWEYTMDTESVRQFHRILSALVVHQIPDGCGGWHLIARLPAPTRRRRVA